MNSRSMITLAVAVVIGLGAMKLSQQMLSSKNKAGDDSQDVLVAAAISRKRKSSRPTWSK